MNVVYNNSLKYVKIEQIVCLVSIAQHIFSPSSFNLPTIIVKKLQKYIHSLIALENLEGMRFLFDDSLNSSTLSNYYRNIYVPALNFRKSLIAKKYGLSIGNH
jgi:hypothetical protein